MNVVPVEHLETAKRAITEERRRVLRVMLHEVGVWRLSGEERIANILDQLALRIEHPELDH